MQQAVKLEMSESVHFVGCILAKPSFALYVKNLSDIFHCPESGRLLENNRSEENLIVQGAVACC